METVSLLNGLNNLLIFSIIILLGSFSDFVTNNNIMVSPWTHLVKNNESQSLTNEFPKLPKIENTLQLSLKSVKVVLMKLLLVLSLSWEPPVLLCYPFTPSITSSFQ